MVVFLFFFSGWGKPMVQQEALSKTWSGPASTVPKKSLSLRQEPKRKQKEGAQLGRAPVFFKKKKKGEAQFWSRGKGKMTRESSSIFLPQEKGGGTLTAKTGGGKGKVDKTVPPKSSVVNHEIGKKGKKRREKSWAVTMRGAEPFPATFLAPGRNRKKEEPENRRLDAMAPQETSTGPGK